MPSPRFRSLVALLLPSGQSNMHASLGVRHPDKERILNESDDPWVRRFTVVRNDKRASPRELAGVWRAANRANLTASRADGGSSVAYFFSRELRKKLNRPIGVLHASVGATPQRPRHAKTARARCVVAARA